MFLFYFHPLCCEFRIFVSKSTKSSSKATLFLSRNRSILYECKKKKSRILCRFQIWRTIFKIHGKRFDQQIFFFFLGKRNCLKKQFSRFFGVFLKCSFRREIEISLQFRKFWQHILTISRKEKKFPPRRDLSFLTRIYEIPNTTYLFLSFGLKIPLLSTNPSMISSFKNQCNRLYTAFSNPVSLVSYVVCALSCAFSWWRLFTVPTPALYSILSSLDGSELCIFFLLVVHWPFSLLFPTLGGSDLCILRVKAVNRSLRPLFTT